jgi:hypothetical protein
LYAPLSNDDRSVENIYQIIAENNMDDLLNEKMFGSLFGMYEKIIVSEKSYSKNAS